MNENGMNNHPDVAFIQERPHVERERKERDMNE